jgi:hypothetical protein
MENPLNQQLLNKLETLKNALKYYADQSHYDPKNPTILNDAGHQARFALDLINKIDTETEKITDDVQNMLNDIDTSNTDETISKMNEVISKLNDYSQDVYKKHS